MSANDVAKFVRSELIDRLIALVGKMTYYAHGGTSGNLPWGLFVKILLDLHVYAINWPELVPFPGSKGRSASNTTRRGILSLSKPQLTILLGFLTNCSHPSHKFQFMRMSKTDKGELFAI